MTPDTPIASASAPASRPGSRTGADPTARAPAAVSDLLARTAAGERLDLAAGALLHDHAPAPELMRLAHARRAERVPPAERVTFLIDRNINYTNVCITDCQFCAFYRPPGHPESYVNSREILGAKIEELVAHGGTRILMQGGHHPELKLAWYVDLVRWIRTTFPTIEVDAFSPSEIQHIADLEGLAVTAVLEKLIAAGLAGLPGGGAEILADEVRSRIAPKKQSAAGWLSVMREAQRLGLATTATMVIGFGETTADRLTHLERLRSLQDEALATHKNGFIAFIVWTAQFENTSLGASRFRPTFGAGPDQYLRMVALARLYLDNIPHLQASWPTMGPEVASAALRAGADDFGSTMLEENVVSAAGTVRTRMDAAEIRDLLRAQGWRPAQRDTRYRILAEYPAAS